MVTAMTPDNPLRKHFRQPAIYISLPSSGRWYEPNSLVMPPNRELPVLPMTATDEITSRTPDALFNGSAVISVIASCVPAIKNPWSVPSCDINVLLIGIRIASYGHDMNIASRCPKCSHDHEFVLDLRKLLESLGRPDYDKKLQIGDLTFGFRPLTYRQINDNNILQYEDQKLMRIMNQTDLTDQKKMELIGDSFRKITQLTMIAVSQCIAAISTDSSIVTDQNHIAEYLVNCEKDIFNQIRDHIGELKTVSDFRPLDLTCENCGHQYQQEFSLDISNFFETNS